MATTEERPFLTRTGALIALTVLARLAYMVLMPATYSHDVHAWQDVAQEMHVGANPYVTTSHLHWPPMWPIVIWVLSMVGRVTGLYFIHCLLAFLILVDVVNLLLARKLIARSSAISGVQRALLFGLVLNPISILLTMQHGNFDALVAMWLLLFLGALWSHQASGDRASWLLACIFLGMGVFTKTVPLLLAPLLLIGLPRRSIGTDLLGLALFVGPALIGMGVLWIADADSVVREVFGYRSYAGWFGITGILQLGSATGTSRVFERVGPLLIIGLMAWGTWKIQRRAVTNSLAALRMLLSLLIGLIALGHGYSPQYIGWYLPLLVVLYAMAGRHEQRVLSLAYIICIGTYVVEYALIHSHGAFLMHWTTNASALQWQERFAQPGPQTLLRLPLFIAYLVVLHTISLPLRDARSLASAVAP